MLIICSNHLMIVMTTDLLINALSQYHLTVILECFVQLFHYCDWYKYYILLVYRTLQPYMVVVLTLIEKLSKTVSSSGSHLLRS